MEVDWSTAEGLALISENVSQTKVTIATTVLVLSFIFLLQTNYLAMQPLRNIHQRMSSVIAGTAYQTKPLASLFRESSVRSTSL